MAHVQSPESEAKIAAMFDRIAPRYDLLNRLLSMRQDVRWRRHLTARVPFRPGGNFLDVATGTGDILLSVATRRQEYASYVGADISEEMLSLARKKARVAKIGQRTEFLKASAEQLTLPAGRFDCVTISFGLRNVVHKENALREFHRVLASGGVLLILEFFLPRRGPLAWLFQWYFHQVLPRIGSLVSDKEAYRYLPESVGSFYSADELSAALYKTGYHVTASENFLFGACRLVCATKI